MVPLGFLHCVAAVLLGPVIASSPDGGALHSSTCVEGVACASSEEDTVSLLQMDVDYRRASLQSTVEQRAMALMPLAWMHIPRTGSAFLNTLLHNPTVCPHTPADLWMPDQNGEERDQEMNTEVFCPGGWSQTFPLHQPIGVHAYHPPIGPVFDLNFGHWVTMLRQPEQRVISLWYHMLDRYGADFPDMETFVRRNSAVYVKSLTASGIINFNKGAFAWLPTPTEEQDALAVQRLREGFAFVGLAEEWSKSICLFHVMFGGACSPEEFKDMHVDTNRTSHNPHDTAVLNGFEDVHDAKVYEEAKRLFESHIERYSVIDSSCPSMCM